MFQLPDLHFSSDLHSIVPDLHFDFLIFAFSSFPIKFYSCILPVAVRIQNLAKSFTGGQKRSGCWVLSTFLFVCLFVCCIEFVSEYKLPITFAGTHTWGRVQRGGFCTILWVSCQYCTQLAQVVHEYHEILLNNFSKFDCQHYVKPIHQIFTFTTLHWIHQAFCRVQKQLNIISI